jgi:hypothetical protein
VAERKVARVEKELIRHRLDVTAAEAALAEATRRRDYLARDPALPGPAVEVQEQATPAPITRPRRAPPPSA